MSRLERIYALLEPLNDPSVDQALVAALPTADPHAQALIAACLLRRRRPQGLVGLVGAYEGLVPAVRQRLVQEIGILAPALGSIDPSQERAAAGALALIRAAGAIELADVVVYILRRSSAALRAEAAQVLLELCQQLGRVRSEDWPKAGRGVQLLWEALEQAVDCFGEHGEATVLLAALSMPANLWRKLGCLDKAEHPATQALGELLARPQEAVVRRALLPALAVPSLFPAARTGLGRINVREHLEEVLACWEVLLDPAVQRAVQELPAPESLLPAAEELPKLSESVLRVLPLWIRRLPLASEEAIRRFNQLRELGDPALRWLVFRHLVEMAEAYPEPNLLAAVGSFCQEAEPAMARRALTVLLAKNWSGLENLLPRLVNSPHESVRRRARERLRPLAFQRLWEGWPVLSEAQRVAAGAALLKLDPEVPAKLNQRLTAPGRGTRLRALSMVYHLSLGSIFEPLLLHLAQSPDAKVASAAVKALGTASSERARTGLRQALDHPDSRVRANAIEALEHLNAAEHVDRLLEIAQRDEGRPRANAIKALLPIRTDEALAALTQMLKEANPRQRTSALWLVETAGVVDVARLVAEMSLSDPNPQVRARAERVIRRLIDRMSAAGQTAGKAGVQKSERSAQAGEVGNTSSSGSAGGDSSPAKVAGILAFLAGWWMTATAWAVRIPEGPEPLPWDEFIRRWPKNLPDEYWRLSPIGAALFASVVVLVLVLWMWERLRRGTAELGPLRTFHQLADALGLRWTERRLLIQIARYYGLPSPITLLLSPATMDYYVQAYCQSMSGRQRAALELRIRDLQQRVFGV